MRKFVALIAVHNRLLLTQRCIEALRVAAGGKFECKIVVVDDGSTDGTKEWLESQSDVERLAGDGNLWFGGATDLGLRYIFVHHPQAVAVMILNNDTFIRPDGLNHLFRCINEETVAAAAYWVEDRKVSGSAGFLWFTFRGLLDTVICSEWLNAKSSGQNFISVDAVATTMTLYPMALLKRVRLPSVGLHPHNRYDAVLSARLRAVGAGFQCSAQHIGDHVYGPMSARPTVRKLKLREFFYASFSNPISTWYLPGVLASEWETAPSFLEGIWCAGRRLVRFSIQLIVTALNSLSASVRGSKRGNK